MSFQPLNPTLYNALLKAFKSVKVVKEGYRLKTTPEMYRGVPSPKVIAHGEAYLVCCPMCQDTKHHLYVSHAFGTRDFATGKELLLAHCFRHSGSAVKAIKDALKWYKVKLDTELPPSNVPEKPHEDVFVSPGVCIQLDQEDSRLADAKRYMLDRGIDPVWASRTYGISFCVDADGTSAYHGAIVGRIVIPVWMDDKLVGWQGRRITSPEERENHFISQRYLSMPGTWRSRSLLGFNQAKDSDIVVVVEGPFDMLRQGPPCVATLGQTVSGAQFDLIAETWGQEGKTIIWVGDSGEDETIAYNVRCLRGRCKAQVYDPRLPEGDPGDWEHAKFFDFIVSHVNEKLALRDLTSTVK